MKLLTISRNSFLKQQNINRWTLRGVCCCLMLCACVHEGGCEKKSDRNQSVATTEASLRLWGEAIVTAHEAGLKILDCQSLGEALALLVSNGIIDETSYKWLKQDYWGHSLRWTIRKKQSNSIVQITSRGKNASFENGEGDDLWVKVQIPEKSKPVVIVHYPDED